MGSKAPPGYLRFSGSSCAPRNDSAPAMATNSTASSVSSENGTGAPRYVGEPPLTACNAFQQVSSGT